MITFSNITFNDVLFVITFLIYLKLAVDFMASLAPPKKRRGQRGTWIQDETRGAERKGK